MKFLFVFFFLYQLTANIFPQSLYINEIMSSNNSAIADEDGDFEDWIEIYNSEDFDIDLTGFYISDDPADPLKWKFNETDSNANIIYANNYKIIFASDKDRPSVTKPFVEFHHTNFKIKAEGETILLSDKSGNIVSTFPPVELTEDISFGRKPDGTGSFYFFDEPTPGSANTTTGYQQSLLPPVFSHQAGFYTDEFDLILSSVEEGAEVFYTVDGSYPDTANLTSRFYRVMNSYPDGLFQNKEDKTFKYSAPVHVRNRNSDPNDISLINTRTYNNYPKPTELIEKAVTIRAVSVKENFLTSPVVSKTFFVSPEINSRFDLPVVSIMTDNRNLFDHDSGNYVAGAIYNRWIKLNPGNLDVKDNANYQQPWERPVNLEIFEQNGVSVLNQLSGYRIHGNFSAQYAHKSLRFYARSEYGENEFAYRIFPDLGFKNYKRFLLRNSGNDALTSMLLDGFNQTLVKHLKFDTQAYRPAVLFINGEYWGMHNFRERVDKYFFKQHYGIDEENIDIIENGTIPDEGDVNQYNIVLDFVKSNDMSEPENFNQVTKLIDIENFTQYTLSNIFIANSDWPYHNVKMWRSRTNFNPDVARGHEGQFRWIMFDTDGGFLQDTSNTLLTAITSIGPVSDFLKKLLDNISYKNYFINTASDLMNTAFIPDRMLTVLEKCSLAISKEIVQHIKRGRHINDVNSWNNFIDSLRVFALNRNGYLKDHLSNYFNLEGEATLTLDISDKEGGFIRINSVKIDSSTVGLPDSLNPYPWNGKYFVGIPIEIEAIPKAGYVFKSWSGDSLSHSKVLEINLNNSISLTAHFEKENVVSTELSPVHKDYFLSQNYPNPFNPTTTFSYNLPYESKVIIKIYNALGETVKLIEENIKPAGIYNNIFYAEGLSSGVYFYFITAEALEGSHYFSQIKKMILVK